MQIIVAIIGIVIVIGLLRWAFPYVIKAALLLCFCWLSYYYWMYVIPCVIISAVILSIYIKKEKEKISKWKSNIPDPISEGKLITQISDLTQSNINYDDNPDKNYIFSNYTNNQILPYGRINAFLNFFDTSTHDTTPIYFSANKSKDRYELREYGSLITDKGIYISKQIERSDNTFSTKNIFVPFAGVVAAEGDNNKLEISCISPEEDFPQKYTIYNHDTTLSLSSIKQLCNSIVTTSIPSILYHNSISFQNDIDMDEKFISSDKIKNMQDGVELGAIMGSNENFNIYYNENKNYMDAARGHGYAAEYGNNTLDRLKGRDVINAAQKLDENGRQIKNGADRVVEGQEIQTKYLKTANESIGEAFEHGKAKYIATDGKMMQIEVPKDQYPQALKAMQKRIDKGEVPGAKPGDSAELFVRKGQFTYAQSFNIAQAGNLDSLKVDVAAGIVSSSYACGISGAIIFATCIWNGKDAKEAARLSLITSAKAMGKSVLLYTLTMQLSRAKISNLFVTNFVNDNGKFVAAGFKSINNPVATLSNSIAKSIRESTLAKTSLGEALGLRAITGRAIISGTIIGCVIFGPDIVRAIRGKISKRQLFKNSTVGASGLIGASLGQALIPIPVVGAIAGATITTFLAKKTLDQFVEDDSVLMFQIFKEQFLDTAMMIDLTKEEFDEFTNDTIMREDLQKILINMYASGEPRKYVTEAILQPTLHGILSKRSPVHVDLIDEGFVKIAEEVALAS